MNADLLQRLTNATSEADRQLIVLEFSISALPEVVQEAVQIAAIPHWFDTPFLEALLDEGSREPFNEQNGFAALTKLNFVELTSGRGYRISGQTRKILLGKLWQENPERYQELSGRAASYCATQENETPIWLIERIYHLLVSNPEAGGAELRRLINEWQSFRRGAFGQVEQITRVALEHVEAGRLSGEGEGWARLWQAKMGLLYDRPELAEAQLSQLDQLETAEPRLLAEIQRTWGDFYAAQEDEEQKNEAYQTAVDLYYAADEQIEAQLLQAKLPEAQKDTSAETVQPAEMSATRRQLIENVRSAWVDGVLKQSLSHVIDLQLQQDNSQTDQAANWVLHRPDGIDRELPHNFSLSNLFELSQQSMLILGAPGSGKTITLLQLLEELLNNALVDATAPVPLLFNLSSWRKGSLLSWLVNHVYSQYRLRKTYATEQLQEGRFVLLLDGLDEVPLMYRDDCVNAINRFLQSNENQVVICSRIADYEALEKHLQVHEAMVLQPLTNKQIDRFLAVGKAKWKPLQQLISEDPQLLELVRSPLLLNILTLISQSLDLDTLDILNTAEQKRDLLLEQYVQSRLNSRDLIKSETYNHFTSVKWLSFIAYKMQKIGTTIFYIEDMQAQFLLSSSYLNYYRTIYGSILGFISGLMSGLASGLISRGLASSLIGGLSLAIGGIGTGIGVYLSNKTQKIWTRFVIAATVTWLTSGFIEFLREYLNLGPNISIGLGVGIAISGGLAGLVDWIAMRENIELIWPSKKHMWLSLKRGVVGGATYMVIFAILFTLIEILRYASTIGFIEILNSDLPTRVERSIFYSITFGLGVGILGGPFLGMCLSFIDTPSVNERLRPGQGILDTLQTSLFMAIFASIFFGLISIGIDALLGTQGLFFFWTFPNIFSPFFTYYGGLAYIQHWTLRFMLWWQGSLPFRLISFLDAMTQRGLLRKVGGGYIFIHRFLLEYFAGLYDGEE